VKLHPALVNMVRHCDPDGSPYACPIWEQDSRHVCVFACAPPAVTELTMIGKDCASSWHCTAVFPQLTSVSLFRR
jgi:hypothetical protein